MTLGFPSTLRFLCLVLPAVGWLAACGGTASSVRDVPDAFPGSSPAFFTPSDTLRLEAVPDVRFGGARAVAVDPFGIVYVADAARHVVVKITATGALEAVLGGPGSREGEFDEPSGLDATNGLVLIVADANNRRIQRFSRSHAYLGSIPLAQAGAGSSDSRVTYRRGEGDVDGFGTGRPVAVVSSESKETYAIDGDRNVILKWDENLRPAGEIGDLGAGRGTLAEPVDLAVGPRSQLYVADRGRRAVVVFDEFGSFVRALGESRLTGLRSVAVGHGVVIAGQADRVTLYDVSGTLIGSMAVDLDAPLVDLVIDERRTLFVLTPTRLYRAPIPMPIEP